MSQKISYTFGLHSCFKVPSRFFTNRLKSPIGTLYKLNIIDLGYLVSSSMAQISISSSLQLHEILILLKHKSLQTTIHTPPFCRLCWQKLDPNIQSSNVRCSRSLKHSTRGLMLNNSEEFINMSVLLLGLLIF